MSEAAPHGGRLIAARRAFPDAPAPFLDLSTGINPHPYPLPDLRPAAFTRLPEPEEVAALEAAAAAAYGVADPARVVAAPGTQALIQVLPRLLPQRVVAVPGPTYAGHARAWREAGARVIEGVEPGAADASVLCNPNNPDGRRLPAAHLLATVPRGLLVVDEAFVDLEPDAATLSLAPQAGQPGAEAVVVLRSFGKTYGLAGLRLGFAVAAPDLAAALRTALGPWAVSGPAIAAGLAALADAPWRGAMGARLAREAAALDACLRAAGLDIVGGTVLFRLAAGAQAPSLREALGRAGILVRHFAAEPRWLRFGLPADDAAWARLQRALGVSLPASSGR
jgi:cobalamin biosynthetic protein CobC